MSTVKWLAKARNVSAACQSPKFKAANQKKKSKHQYEVVHATSTIQADGSPNYQIQDVIAFRVSLYN